jgi:hypothetical protein
MAGETSDDFQNELVDLFVQEAQEWLQNIHVALDELQQGPAPDRHAALIEILSGGVTNLGGSAATINLPEVEQASYAAIPFIDALKDPQKSFSVQDFLSLCKQLGQIQGALTRATGVSFEAHEEASAGAVQPTVSPANVLESLRKIRSGEQIGETTDRSVVGTMIEQLEAQVNAGVQQIPVEVIQGYLDRVSASEEAFVKCVDTSVSVLIDRLSVLAKSPSSAPGVLEASLQDVTQLRADAQQVNAIQAITFFSGLQSFLAVVVQHRVQVATQRIEAVSLRLETVKELIHRWVEQGRVERAAIGQVLPASQSS